MKRTLLAALLLALASSAGAAVLRVEAGQSIAAALRAARAGDTVRVAAGSYRESLVIDKPLTLQGAGKVVLSAGGKGDVIRVQASDVTIRGLVVRDSGTDLDAQNAGIYIQPHADRAVVRNCALLANLFGIWLEESADALIENNTIVGRADLYSADRGNGIQVYNTVNSRVIGNTVSFTRDGIYVDYSRHALFRGNRLHDVRYGTHYMNTNDSTWEDNETWHNRGGLALMEVRHLTVRRNRAWGNEEHGIMLRTIQDSLIENNIVAGNDRGFFIYDAEFNTIRGNLVVGNRNGVQLTAGSSNNEVDGNDFIDNREQVEFVASKDVEWGRKLPNYWSNYRGWDQDGDGRGDLRYEANDIVDRISWQYPLAKLMLSSPALQALRFAARQFPVLRAPSVTEQHPRMKPWNSNWSKWNGGLPH
ncbi:nitrous oxide reductase family maturation protein NosD [Massilia terrae]|uniref:Nitrous oxide reductase family maturation protein NosD n=1 Tax=Massilia terrae TaxID=1811224 RepID=A0ABT2D4I6_9BURK|nr:nitrous oxide reductase family maturation protein NosD [Massilia terrae]MCS0660955.1 nitrous oxide reductase family maturation protein NosD [Massilia terrae]